MLRIQIQLMLLLMLSMLMTSTKADCSPDTDGPCITIVNGISLTDVVKPAGAEPGTSVKLQCSRTGVATIIYSNNGNPFADGFPGSSSIQSSSANKNIRSTTATCAKFDITGSPDATYTINFSAITTPSGITLTNYECISASDGTVNYGTLTAGGTDSVYCGGEITVANTASDGAYNGSVSYDVTVTCTTGCTN